MRQLMYYGVKQIKTEQVCSRVVDERDAIWILKLQYSSEKRGQTELLLIK